jgi:hypothetical protein
MKSNWVALVLVGFAASMAACAVGVDPTEGGDVGTSSQAVKPPKECPQIMVKCLEGYYLKKLPNCSAICVPDQGFECDRMTDCGPIYCLTTPCPQPVCKGHACVLPEMNGPDLGDKCGNTVCKAGVPCCNSSCGICGEVCIQIACTPSDPMVF